MDRELDDVVDPKGWIGEAFELLEKDIDGVKQELKEVNGKIDIILRHITGTNQE